MKKYEWSVVTVTAITSVAALLVGIGAFYLSGGKINTLTDERTIRLMIEVVIAFAAFFVISRKTNTQWKRLILITGMILIYSWLHRIFLPLIVSSAYMLLIIRTGAFLRRRIDRDHQFVEFHHLTLIIDFVMGSSLLILLYAVMSLLGIGSIPNVRIAALILAGIFLAVDICHRKEENPGKARLMADLRSERGGMSYAAAIFVSVILSVLLLQLLRINICADYDSLHYSLRSEYILNNGGGIYEDLGSVHVVYTYSKGLEVLMFPLSGLSSYGYFLCFQLLVTAGSIYIAGKTAGLFIDRRYSTLCMTLMACIPAITNMGISGKTDAVTLLFQLIMIYMILLYLKKEKTVFFVMALYAYFMTLILKPTSLVFSSVAALVAVIYTLVTRKLQSELRSRWFFALIPAVLTWGLMWLRTVKLTGIPVTSVFYQIWEKLGFHVRYPFLFQELPSSGEELSLLEMVKYFLKRVYGVLLAPVTPDMDHVWIAWAGPILLVFLVMLLLIPCIRKFKKREFHAFWCFVSMFLATGVVSLVTLYLLYQVDGNYFLLLYSMFVILISIIIGRMKERKSSLILMDLLTPLVVFNLSVTAITNWNGSVGLTPVSLIHKGYYDHKAENRQMLAECGNRKIYDILAEDPETRVVVFGEQPKMLLFPCNAQSYTDIEGSDGNVFLSASPEALGAFFDRIGLDYVYLQRGYVYPGTDGWKNITAMIREGYLTDIIYEEGNALARFTSESSDLSETRAELSEFADSYWNGAMQMGE